MDLTTLQLSCCNSPLYNSFSTRKYARKKYCQIKTNKIKKKIRRVRICMIRLYNNDQDDIN